MVTMVMGVWWLKIIVAFRMVLHGDHTYLMVTRASPGTKLIFHFGDVMSNGDQKDFLASDKWQLLL